MRYKKIVLIILLALSLCYHSFAATGNAKVFHCTSLNSHGGTSSDVRLILSNMGYSATKTTDPSKTTVKTSFGNNKVVHLQCHGAAGFLELASGVTLTANEISSYYSNLNNTRFVFLLSCNTANSSTTYGDLDNTLYNLGTDCTLAFSGPVSAVGALDEE